MYVNKYVFMFMGHACEYRSVCVYVCIMSTCVRACMCTCV